MVKQCLFCGSLRDLSREHIIPIWLLKELGIQEEDLSTPHISALGDKILSRRKHKAMNLINPLVCESCNNGWMSRLERAAKPLLIRLMNMDIEKGSGEVAAEVADFLRPNAFLLSKWIMKTALLINYPSNYFNIVPRFHFNLLHNNSIPPGVKIDVSFSEEQAATHGGWVQSFAFPLDFKEDEILDLYLLPVLRNMYKFCFQFKRLLIRIRFSSFGRIPAAIIRPPIQLWPNFGTHGTISTFENLSDFVHSDYDDFRYSSLESRDSIIVPVDQIDAISSDLVLGLVAGDEFKGKILGDLITQSSLLVVDEVLGRHQ